MNTGFWDTLHAFIFGAPKVAPLPPIPQFVGNFYRDVIKKDPRFNSPDAVKDLNLLEPVTRAAVLAIIADAAKMGLKLVPVETYRSQARQLYFYNKKMTQIKEVGCHHFGVACDLALIKNGVADPLGSDYKFMRFLAESHGLISGYDWGRPDQPHSFRDADHVQRVAVSRQTGLFADSWYPDRNYEPMGDLGRYVPTAMGAPDIVAATVAFAKPARTVGPATSIIAVAFSIPAKQVRDYFVAQGLTNEQACGLSVQARGESSYLPRAVGDHNHAFGLFQLHTDRAQKIKDAIGIDMAALPPFADQLRAVWWELNNTESGALRRIKATTTAYDAGYVACRYWERPSDPTDWGKRAQWAADLFATLPPPTKTTISV